MPIEKRHGLKEQFPDAEHPVVRKHPETGEKMLFVNSHDALHQLPHVRRTSATARTIRPGANLLNYLIARAIPEYQVRWRWRPNSVAIWDNRCTQHYAVMDYWPAVRKMERQGSSAKTLLTERITMQFMDDSLLPENQDPWSFRSRPTRRASCRGIPTTSPCR